MQTPLGWKAWLRAALITVALVVHGIFALPSPYGIDEGDLHTPEGKEEIRRWTSILGAVGVDVSVEQLSAQTIYWTHAIHAAHSKLRRPFIPWMKFTGTGQGWALFASPDTYPHRLEIYVLEDRKWRPVFVRNHPTLDFLDRTLRYRRVRGVYDGSTRTQRVPYWNFARWVARQAFVAYPKAGKVRIQMVQTHTTVPGEPEDTEEIVRVKRVLKRSAILPADGLVP